MPYCWSKVLCLGVLKVHAQTHFPLAGTSATSKESVNFPEGDTAAADMGSGEGTEMMTTFSVRKLFLITPSHSTHYCFTI